jgi:hypothetical protein
MPLLAPVLEAARTRKETMRRALQPAQLAAWRSVFLARWWLPLPVAPGQPRRPLERHVAVDGTSHSIELSTGAHFVLAAAAAIGPDPVGQRTAADMEVIPARYEEADAATARDLMMQLLETAIANQAGALLAEEGRSAEAILWLDGSIHSSLVHLAGAPGPLFEDRAAASDGRQRTRWALNVERATNLLRFKANLFEIAQRTGLWLVAVAKTQRAGFLFDALAATPEGQTQARAERMADGELLAAAPAGWSWPVILDGRTLPAVPQAVAEWLGSAPAIVSCYVRPHLADLPLRIDVPAGLLGLQDRLLPAGAGQNGPPEPRWAPDPDLMRPVVEAVLASYGGVHAYNAPLYAVDRLVRLSRHELETRYLPICARIIGVEPGILSVDRGRRRFLIS